MTLIGLFAVPILHILSYAGFNLGNKIENVIVLILVALFVLLTFIKFEYGVLGFITFLFADSGGILMELGGLSIKTILLIIITGLGIIKYARTKKYKDNNVLKLIALFLFLGIYGVLLGISRENAYSYILQDAIPFLFLLFYFPLSCIEYEFAEKNIKNIFLGALVGHVLLALILFSLFSTGAEALQNDFYDWIRQKCAGKITYLGNSAFRIAMPVYFLLSALGFSSVQYLRVILLGVLSSFNLSRAYIIGGFLSLFIGFIHQYKPDSNRLIQKLFLPFSFLLVILISTALIYGTASGGKSFGISNLIGRTTSIISEGKETSADARRALLKPIFNLIALHSVFGSGFGSQISVYDVHTSNLELRRDFDWGYLEILAELGIIGAALLLITLGVIFKLKIVPFIQKNFILLFFILFTNIFAQTLFHIYGMFLIAYMLYSGQKYENRVHGHST